MLRLSEIADPDLSEKAKEVFAEIKKTRGVVRGPFAVLLHIPDLAQRVASVGEFIRYHGQLEAEDRELAILTCGKEIGARYEWFEHESVARSAGVRSEVIEALRFDGELDELTERESLIIGVVRALCRQSSLSDSLYSNAVIMLGETNLLELTTLVGYYVMLGLVINSFNIKPPADATNTF